MDNHDHAWSSPASTSAPLLAPHSIGDPQLVAAYSGWLTDSDFAGTIVGYYILRRAPCGGQLIGVGEARTVLVTVAVVASLRLLAHMADRLPNWAARATRPTRAASVRRGCRCWLIMPRYLLAAVTRAC